jgi:hypothetical protein
VSYDVKSLYTSIPQDFAFNSIKEIISEDEIAKTFGSLEVEYILDLLHICMKST